MTRSVTGLKFTALLLCGLFGSHLRAQEQAEAVEQTLKAAVERVAPCIVQVETSGGTDLIGSGPRGPQIRTGTGPTTGVIVSADGYILTSAYNFANKPSAIFVGIPGRRERLVAKQIATDHTRMLTLLKVDATDLPTPAPAPKKELRVGQYSVALGRTWSSYEGPPSVSIGVLSALGRIWGKTVQTDAKVSPINYGGPLVDIAGRVIGILVPASPRGEDETAGVEWYDSGIGFAVPLEDMLAVLPRLKEGKDLHRGLLGVTMESTDIYGAGAVIAQVAPESAAGKAGVKAGDEIIEINGKPVTRQAQMMHVLGDKYEGDTVSIKVRRKEEKLEFANLKLAGRVSSYAHPFLGILPVRDDPEPGEAIRYVFPGSPAEKAGLKAGDRLLALAPAAAPRLQPFTGRDALTSLLNRFAPASDLTAGTELKLDVQRKDGKKEQVKITPGAMTEIVPTELPEPSTRKQALARKKKDAEEKDKPAPGDKKEEAPKPDPKEARKEEARKPDTGVLTRTNAAGDRKYWLYVPDNYDPNITHALVVWLHPANKGQPRDLEAMLEIWQESCAAKHMIVLAPQADNGTDWLASEVEGIEQVIREVEQQYAIDTQRIIAHGMGNGGQMALYLGFNARHLIRGVATTGAVLTAPAKENLPDQRLAFFLVAGGKDPLAPAIRETQSKLKEKRFPVTFREIADMGHQYLDVETLEELVRWIDSLDRQ